MSETENMTQLPDVVDQAVEQHEKSPQQSFAELRKAKEDLERQLWQAKKEKELYEQQVSMQMKMHQQQSSHIAPEEEFNIDELEREEFPDGKKLSKAFKSFDKKLSGYNQKLTEKDAKIAALETAIEFPDFKEVVTAENIEKYIKSDEDNAEAVQYAKNPLRKVYNLIKKSAAYQAEMASKAVKDKPISQEQKRVDDKAGKPVHGSIGVRSDAVQTAARMSNSTMSKEQRNALWKETMAAARR